MWIKNTAGKKDAMLTFAVIAFLVATGNILLSTVGMLSVGDFEISFKALDAAIMSTYMGIAFSAYVGRRWTDTKYSDSIVPGLSEKMTEFVDDDADDAEAPPSMS